MKSTDAVGVRRVQDLFAFQTAQKAKRLIYAVARSRPRAMSDRAFTSQLFSAASSVEANIAEGFHRCAAREFRQFLRYALASLSEAELRLEDGSDRGYFTADDCREAFAAIKHCRAVTIRLFTSLEPFTRSGRKGLQGPGATK